MASGLVAAGAMLAAVPATANDWLSTGTYVGANVAFDTRAAVSPQQVRNGLPAADSIDSVSIDESGTAWRLFVGKRFNRHFSAEFGFVDLGEIDFAVEAESLTPNTYLRQLADVTPVAPAGMAFDSIIDFTLADLGMQGTWAARVPITMRAGLWVWRADVSYGPTATRERTDLDFHWGLGTGWRLGDRYDLRFEWERYNAHTDMDTLSVGLVYRF